MTRLALLADVHGNLPALEAVLARVDGQAVDQIVVAGDLINWGPFSAAVLEHVLERGCVVIRGNNEYYLLEYGTVRMPAHWRDYELLPWLAGQLGERWRREVACWPDELSLRFADAPALRVLHGAPGDPWRSLHPLLPEAALVSLLAGVDEPVVLAAHSHLPLDRRAGRWHLINPGSVGVPLDGRPGVARYALLEGSAAGWRVEQHCVRYDPAPLFAEFERQRFVERFGITAQLVIEEFRQARLQVHAFNEWRRQCSPGSPLDANTLARFRAADIWQYTPMEYHVGRA
ncbi:MAG: metallophosphoesterase family protein [Anaerolineaceae bacterium]|nr:metallophosphoesterase family protein [Anaerolineaceae bacterium]